MVMADLTEIGNLLIEIARVKSFTSEIKPIHDTSIVKSLREY
jgi:hypothetical protein